MNNGGEAEPAHPYQTQKDNTITTIADGKNNEQEEQKRGLPTSSIVILGFVILAVIALVIYSKRTENKKTKPNSKNEEEFDDNIPDDFNGDF